MRIDIVKYPKGYLLVICCISVLVSSCGLERRAVYFKDMPADTTLTNLISKPLETAIIPGDLLSIVVASLSPENTAIYNAAPNTLDGMQGYLVNDSGYIEFIKLGQIKASGLTKTELSRQLQKNLEAFLGQNVVTVGIQNRHVTLMGGVSPKVLPLTHNMTLLDALAQTGDIGEKGRIDNVLVVRSSHDGQEKTFKRIDLNNKSLFYSPYYYMQPDDIVYVEPVKPRMQTMQIVSFAMTTLSFLIIIYDRISRL